MALPITRHKMKWQQPCPPPKKKHTVCRPPPKEWPLWIWLFDSLACMGFFTEPNISTKIEAVCSRCEKIPVAIADLKLAPKMFTKRNGIRGSCVHQFWFESIIHQFVTIPRHMQKLRNSMSSFGNVRKLCTVRFWSKFHPVCTVTEPVTTW